MLLPDVFEFALDQCVLIAQFVTFEFHVLAFLLDEGYLLDEVLGDDALIANAIELRYRTIYIGQLGIVLIDLLQIVLVELLHSQRLSFLLQLQRLKPRFEFGVLPLEVPPLPSAEEVLIAQTH